MDSVRPQGRLVESVRCAFSSWLKGDHESIKNISTTAMIGRCRFAHKHDRPLPMRSTSMSAIVERIDAGGRLKIS